jgi:hypothetical protein
MRDGTVVNPKLPVALHRTIKFRAQEKHITLPQEVINLCEFALTREPTYSSSEEEKVVSLMDSAFALADNTEHGIQLLELALQQAKAALANQNEASATEQ